MNAPTEKLRNAAPDEIRRSLLSEEYSEIEYYNKNGISYKLCDAAALFVMTAYLYETPVEKSKKDELRKRAYNAFFSEDRCEFPKAWAMLDMLIKDTPCSDDIGIKLLKGGSYKIKNYYLENYNLRDIRGASVLLTHAEEDIIPSMISDRFIPECIVYSGGGNIFAVVPNSCDERFALELERAAKELLISADFAYCVCGGITLSDIFGANYRVKMADTEIRLDERKKLIINCTKNAESKFIGKCISIISEKTEDCFDAPVRGVHAEKAEICSACGRRNADYISGVELLCTACLHKRAVGDAAKRSRYINRYNLYNTRTAEPVKKLDDISEDYIAVIYGDGNNMGGIIQQFVKITQMMEFSRDVKNIVDRAVFESMDKHEITRFEVVGLGGDDIFIIVEGRKAIRFTISMIRKYNSRFEKYRSSGQVSTMSAGIAVAKTKMPIRIIIDKAEEMLSEAKGIAKLKPDSCGSLSFEIMDTFDGGESDTHTTSYGAGYTMLPYYTDAAEDIAAMALQFKRDQSRSGLRNVLDAFMNSQSAEEADLFLKYFNVRGKGTEVKPLPIAGYSVDGGFYTDNNGKKYFVWKDILTMLDFLE